jgi:hypothetical protein
MEPSSTEILNGRSDCAEAVERLAVMAEREIALFTQQLEPLLYHHRAVCDRFSQLAREQRHARIRILAQNTRGIAAQGHCLIELAQRLSSKVQIRVPATPELQSFSESWMIVDDHSLLRINNPERWKGSLTLHDRRVVREQLEFFDQAWENSEPDIQTRRLGL